MKVFAFHGINSAQNTFRSLSYCCPRALFCQRHPVQRRTSLNYSFHFDLPISMCWHLLFTICSSTRPPLHPMSTLQSQFLAHPSRQPVMLGLLMVQDRAREELRKRYGESGKGLFNKGRKTEYLPFPKMRRYIRRTRYPCFSTIMVQTLQHKSRILKRQRERWTTPLRFLNQSSQSFG